MTRKNSGLVLAFVVVGILSTPMSAGASDGYQSVDAIIAGSETPSGPVDRLSTPDTYLAERGISLPASASAGASDGYQSVDAIIAGSETPSGPVDRLSTPDTYLAERGISLPASGEPAVVSGSPVDGGDGFDWGDALIGAAATSGLMLITFAAARSVTRHREATVESSA